MNKIDIIGQKNLLSKLDKYTIDTFPHTSLFLGPEGSGKHLLAKYVAENILETPLIDITEKVNKDQLDFIYSVSTVNSYLIDLTTATEKTQNTLLKFAEESWNNIFLFFIAHGKHNILNTILGRCKIFELDPYTSNELEAFVDQNHPDKEFIKKILKTPGLLQRTNVDCFKDTVSLCNKIIEKLGQTNFSNMLKIVDKINYKDNYDKPSVDVFLDIFSNQLLDSYKKDSDCSILKMYKIINNRRKELFDTRINKETFMQSLLIEMWKNTKGN